MQTSLFPHETVRDQQDKLIDAVLQAIDDRAKLVVHAPTGLGKTAASLAPAIERAIANDKVVIFMTSRLTQHMLALSTVSRIRAKHGISIPVVDIIGKKHMCLQPGVEGMRSKEFAEYCKAMREDGLCEYYTRLKTGEQQSAATRSALLQLGKMAPNPPEQVKMVCAEDEHRLCPYEASMLLAKDARVVITDYSYIFNPSIREGFFKRINRELSDCILIIDEGHNLPERVKDLASERITTYTIRRAIGELQKHKEEDHKHHLQEMAQLLATMGQDIAEERYVTKEEFLAALENICPVAQLIEDLDAVAAMVREDQRASSCGAIVDFLTAWSGDDPGFTRILSVVRTDRMPAQKAVTDSNGTDDEASDGEENDGNGNSSSAGIQRSLFGKNVEMPSSAPAQERAFQISYRCLDPSIITKPVLDSAHSAVIMSGTLTPTDMYAQVLGAADARLLTLESPFPTENRLNIIIPKTTTKFTARSSQMYAGIAAVCAQVTEAVPGNTAVFFPSYAILKDVKATFESATGKTVFTEHPSFTKEEREDLLLRFKEYKDSGAVLLAVMGGSFSEGIDLPGDELRAVIVVGLPLSRPDLETKALIEHYEKKFGRGWDYGYIYPAFNKTLQSAGRCIRTETDRGVIVFLDERYAWQNYYACFPSEWNIKITLRYEDLIRGFFEETPAKR